MHYEVDVPNETGQRLSIKIIFLCTSGAFYANRSSQNRRYIQRKVSTEN